MRILIRSGVSLIICYVKDMFSWADSLMVKQQFVALSIYGSSPFLPSGGEVLKAGRWLWAPEMASSILASLTRSLRRCLLMVRKPGFQPGNGGFDSPQRLQYRDEDEESNHQPVTLDTAGSSPVVPAILLRGCLVAKAVVSYATYRGFESRPRTQFV